MPTAEKLVGALAFGALGFVLFIAMARIVADTTNGGSIPGFVMFVCTGAGLCFGWVICGTNAKSLRSGIGNGYTALVAQSLAVLAIMSMVTMYTRATRGRYDGPMDAVMGAFGIVVENVHLFATIDIAMILVIGGFVCGAVTGLVGQWIAR